MRRLFRFFEDLGGLLLGFMTILVLFQVLTRYVFKSPPPWTEELARYVMIWGTLIVSAALSFDKGHINLDYFVNRLPSHIAKIVYIITGVLVTLFLCLFLLSGFGLVETAVQVSQRSPGAGLPMVIVYVVIPAAALLMIGAQVVDLRNAMKGE